MTIEETRDFFKNDIFATGIGCNIDVAEPGHSVISLDIKEMHMNANNAVQGGVMFTMADFSCAVASCCGENKSVSVDGNISYFGKAKGTKLFAQAVCLKEGRTMSYYESEIKDDLGTLVAKGSFTMFRVK